MIKAEFYVNESGDIFGFKIFGHSGYSDFGSDIVCAAVSSASYMTINTLSDVMSVDLDVVIKDDVGFMEVTVSDKDIYRSRCLLVGLKKHLILLEDLYPKNIEVNYLEV